MLAAVAAVVACGPSGARAPTTIAPAGSSSAAGSLPSASAAASVSPAASSTAATPTSGKLTLAQARRYMLELINRDRRTMGLGPVELDEGPPTQSAERHARDMAANAFLGHWGTDGSVPEQRLTEAGGADMVLENAFCITDEKKRELESDPRIDASEVERAEGMFFNEVPPNDGHRKNILKPNHKRVGIGFALAKPAGNEILVPCISQEFIDVLGTYEPIPRSVKAGTKLHVAGILVKEVQMGAVGIGKVETPKPLSTSEANKRRNYPVPKPDVMYWPKGFVTPLPLTVDGQRFSIDIPVPGPGFYEISVWGKRPGDADYATVSLRTLRVE
jgi:uncharacterized protein YkwD